MGYPASDRASVPMTAEEYLAWEAEQKEKHELHHGEVFAMASGSPRHNLLAMSAGAELRGAMRGRGCQVLSSDQRVKLGELRVPRRGGGLRRREDRRGDSLEPEHRGGSAFGQH